MQLKNYVICDSIFSKARGQMFRLKPKTLVFRFSKEQYVPLHMMFVFFPIDVAFLDAEHRVVELKQRLAPFGYYSPKNRAKYVVEFQNGTIRKENLRIGDRITFS